MKAIDGNGTYVMWINMFARLSVWTHLLFEFVIFSVFLFSFFIWNKIWSYMYKMYGLPFHLSRQKQMYQMYGCLSICFILFQVLGPNILRWLWPTANHVGSGLRFRTVYDVAKGASTSKWSFHNALQCSLLTYTY